MSQRRGIEEAKPVNLFARVGLCLVLALCFLLAPSPVQAAPTVPERQLPAGVIAGVRMLDFEFRKALAQDCAPQRCFAKGCIHVAFTVVDQPASSSIPGLNLGRAPGLSDTPAQIFLTTVECSFAHDPSVRATDARALAARLKAKLSRAWTEVDVVHEKLPPVRDFLSRPPDEDPEPQPKVQDSEQEELPEEQKAEPVLEPAGEEELASREFWLSVLPHFFWMIGLALLTLAGLVIIWAIRRLGKASAEEQMLLAQMSQGPDGMGGVDLGATDSPSEKERTTAGTTSGNLSPELERWRKRLTNGKKNNGDQPDPALQALVKDLLRSGERGLLAKAVLLFPEDLPKAFPRDGNLASAKVTLAEYLKSVDPRSLPGDEVFFEKLDRYAVAAELTADADAELLRGLHDDFGPSALVQALEALPARYGTLLFAHASEAMQHEAARLVTQEQALQASYWLMRSNRVDPAETSYLLAVLAALREGAPVPVAPAAVDVSDRGRLFGAPQALSVLLPRLDAEARNKLIHSITTRLNGALPGWIRSTLYGEMLLKLDETTRADLLLQVDVGQLAAWLQVQTATSKVALIQGAPAALREALGAVVTPSAPGELYALAHAGRVALSIGLQRRLAPDFSFQTLLV